MAAFDFAKVKDPTFFKENVLNAHASFRTYASREEYLAGESSLALKLDGIWKFAYAKNYTSAIPGFEKTDYDCSGWDDIHVPAHIQMEGYDIPQYANVQYPWDGREEVQPGEIPQRFNPVASYVKYFELPESMQGKPVHIEFEGVESGMALWLNGSYVGYTEDSFSAHAFDLTPYLPAGREQTCCAGVQVDFLQLVRRSGLLPLLRHLPQRVAVRHPHRASGRCIRQNAVCRG